MASVGDGGHLLSPAGGMDPDFGFPDRRKNSWGIRRIPGESETMNQATDCPTDIAAAVVSLTAEATKLESRMHEIRRELADVKERMQAVTTALSAVRG